MGGEGRGRVGRSVTEKKVHLGRQDRIPRPRSPLVRLGGAANRAPDGASGGAPGGALGLLYQIHPMRRYRSKKKHREQYKFLALVFTPADDNEDDIFYGRALHHLTNWWPATSPGPVVLYARTSPKSIMEDSLARSVVLPGGDKPCPRGNNPMSITIVLFRWSVCVCVCVCVSATDRRHKSVCVNRYSDNKKTDKYKVVQIDI
ncbi:hypothetical protein RRG08_022381 [Elysia crispata]|uniref:Uncharacterized protein n=1 Tax=Elysia crispata TaxID=231223 RepID=A0AAE0Z188_9GAST|nr:hypothetical protein RRG08_022381 [Elysia crispata]